LLLLAGGSTISQGAAFGGAVRTAWDVVRWPLGIALATLGVYLLYRFAPRQRFATGAALLAGTVVAVVLWVIFTVGLALYFSISGTSNVTYGPQLAVLALLLWSVLTSLALHLGLAVAAEIAGEAPAARRVVQVPDVADLPPVHPSAS
jgi:uncharacterized BrkB/YihY/UPF0761 family membrane protein